MKRSIYIAYLLIYLISSQLQALGQTQPQVCGGGKVRYGLSASGLPGSIFKWSVDGGGGHIDADYKDSVDVTWYPETKIGKLLVTEINEFGCAGNTDTAYVNINNASSLTFKLQSAIVCEGTSNTVSAEGNFLKYNWSNGDTLSNLTVTTGGLYKLKATDKDGCTAYDSISLAFYPKPYVNLGSHDTILCSPTMVLNAGTDGQSYQWSNGEITNSILVSNINDGQVFSVVVENEYGCKSSDTINVKACGIIPNTITPNGDGSNDTWQCDRFMGSKVDVQIFDRWGRLVYHSKTGLPAEGWDGTLRGKPLPMDSYYYIVNLNDGSDVIKGTITIIR